MHCRLSSAFASFRCLPLSFLFTTYDGGQLNNRKVNGPRVLLCRALVTHRPTIVDEIYLVPVKTRGHRYLDYGVSCRVPSYSLDFYRSSTPAYLFHHRTHHSPIATPWSACIFYSCRILSAPMGWDVILKMGLMNLDACID